MNIDAYQQQAEMFSNGNVKSTHRMTMGALGVAGEAGELADEIKKLVYHEKPIDIDRIRKEIGDVLWYLAYLCSVFDLNLSDVAQANLDKLKARHGDKFRPHNEQNRTT